MKCGYKNADEAAVCAQCGAPLYPTPPQQISEYRRHEDECFGIPRFGSVISLIFGFILIIMGLNAFLPQQYHIAWGPLFLIIIGLLIVMGALRRR